MGESREVLVVGAGIAGLTTALALAKVGRPVRILEQAAEIAPIGYGIQLGPNTLPIFNRLGIGKEVLGNALLPRALVMREAGGELLATVPLDDEDFSRRFDGRYMAIHRGDLHDILKSALSRLPEARMEVGAQACGYDDHGDSVTVRTVDGRSFRGAAMVASDGLRSVFRALLHPADDLCPIHYSAHRSILAMRDMPAAISRDDVVLWLGPGWHIIHYPLRDREELNVVAVFREDLFSQSSDGAVRKAELKRQVVGADPALASIIDAMDLSKSWPIADRKPIRSWGAGRMTLVGDSAHATLQSLAQGAGMAIEDAAALADCVGKADEDYGAAFEAFRRARLGRTSRVILESRQLWAMYHEDDPLAQEARRRQYQRRSACDLYDCLEWVWRPRINAAGVWS